MIDTLTQWMIGYSLIALLIFCGVFWWGDRDIPRSRVGQASAMMLLASLGVLQIFHWRYLTESIVLFDSLVYQITLFLAPPSFLVFIRCVLQHTPSSPQQYWPFFAPVLLTLVLDGAVAIVCAFVLGAVVCAWLLVLLYSIRAQRRYFEAEMRLLVGFAVTAAAILLAGLSAAWLGESAFVLIYANLTGLFIAILTFLFLRFPDFGGKAEEVALAAYRHSGLSSHDVPALKSRLQVLLSEEKIYRDNALSLRALANRLELSTHQTSELINTQFAMSFSQLLRQYRVAEAKLRLLESPEASVLSIGLDVGFSSQSSFYAAFREHEGLSPGQFRKHCPD